MKNYTQQRQLFAFEAIWMMRKDTKNDNENFFVGRNAVPNREFDLTAVVLRVIIMLWRPSEVVGFDENAPMCWWSIRSGQLRNYKRIMNFICALHLRTYPANNVLSTGDQMNWSIQLPFRTPFDASWTKMFIQTSYVPKISIVRSTLHFEVGMTSFSFLYFYKKEIIRNFRYSFHECLNCTPYLLHLLTYLFAFFCASWMLSFTKKL